MGSSPTSMGPRVFAMRRLPDLDSLQLLMAIGVHGSLSEAGRQHGLGQPAVTARLRAMERQVGMKLVERTPRGSRLTSAGVLVADWARETMASASSLDAGLSALRDGGGSRLTIASSKTVAEHLVPGWLAGLARRHPGATMRLESMDSEDVPDALAAGTADVGFVEGHEASSSLSDREVGRDVLLLVVSTSHPWAERHPRRVSRTELARTRLIDRGPGSAPRLALDHALRDVGVPRPEPLAELPTNHAVVEAVIGGWGPAVLSDLAVGVELAAGTLVEVDVEGPPLRRRLRALWRDDQPLAPLAAELVERAAQHHARASRRHHQTFSHPHPEPTLVGGIRSAASVEPEGALAR